MIQSEFKHIWTINSSSHNIVAAPHIFHHWVLSRCRLQCVEVLNQALKRSLGFSDRRKHCKCLGIWVFLKDHLLIKVLFACDVDLVDDLVKSADELLVGTNFRWWLRNFNQESELLPQNRNRVQDVLHILGNAWDFLVPVDCLGDVSYSNLFYFRRCKLVVYWLELIFFVDFVEKERNTHSLVSRVADWVQNDHERVWAKLADK